MDRKDFFKNGYKGALRDLMKTPVGSVVDHQLHSLANLLAPVWLNDRLVETSSDAGKEPVAETPGEVAFPRPPGAIEDPEEFNRLCTKCNDCITACPYGVIFTLGGTSGPLLDPARYPCHLCEEYHCIAACETGALQSLPDDTLPKFGELSFQHTHCLNNSEKRASRNAGQKREPYCKLCARACPVEAITYDKARLPLVADHCAGCGLCMKDCPAMPDAILLEY